MLLFARKNQSLRRSPNSNRPLLGDIKKESLSAASAAFLYYGTRSGEGELFKNLCKNGFRSGFVPTAISNAIGYAKFCRRSHDASIRVFDESGALIETHESNGVFREPLRIHCYKRLVAH